MHGSCRRFLGTPGGLVTGGQRNDTPIPAFPGGPRPQRVAGRSRRLPAWPRSAALPRRCGPVAGGSRATSALPPSPGSFPCASSAGVAGPAGRPRAGEPAEAPNREKRRLRPRQRRLSFHGLLCRTRRLTGWGRTQKTRGPSPLAPAPWNGQQHPSVFKRRLRHRQTLLRSSGPDAPACGAGPHRTDARPPTRSPARRRTGCGSEREHAAR